MQRRSFWRNLFKKKASLHISYDYLRDETTAYVVTDVLIDVFRHIGEPESTQKHAEDALAEWCLKHDKDRVRYSDFTVHEYRTQAECDTALLDIVEIS